MQFISLITLLFKIISVKDNLDKIRLYILHSGNLLFSCYYSGIFEQLLNFKCLVQVL